MATGERNDGPVQLTLEEIQALDNGNRVDYLALRKMFESSGWQLFMSWVQAEANTATLRQLGAKNWDEFNLSKGQAAAYLTTTNIEKITETTYRNVLESLKEDDNSLEA